MLAPLYSAAVRVRVLRFATHSPDKASDIRASANVLDLVGSGFGKGAIGVTYRRDLDAVAVRDESFYIDVTDIREARFSTDEGFEVLGMMDCGSRYFETGRLECR